MPLGSIPRHPTPKLPFGSSVEALHPAWQSARGRLRSDVVSGVIWRRGYGILETGALPRWHTASVLCTGEIPLLPLHLAEHCNGARQDPGGYGVLVLFPSTGIGILL